MVILAVLPSYITILINYTMQMSCMGFAPCLHESKSVCLLETLPVWLTKGRV